MIYKLLADKIEELKDGNKFLIISGEGRMMSEVERYTLSIRGKNQFNLAYRDGKYFWFDEMPKDYYCYWIGDFDEEEGILPVE